MSGKKTPLRRRGRGSERGGRTSHLLATGMGSRSGASLTRILTTSNTRADMTERPACSCTISRWSRAWVSLLEWAWGLSGTIFPWSYKLFHHLAGPRTGVLRKMLTAGQCKSRPSRAEGAGMSPALSETPSVVVSGNSQPPRWRMTLLCLHSTIQ